MNVAKTTALAAACALSLVLTSCSADSDAADATHARVGVAFSPVANFAPFSADAPIATKLGSSETLVRIDPDGTPSGWLASSWTQPTSSSVVFELRPKVRFHDGSTMDAEAVAHSLNEAFSSPFRPRGLGSAALKATATDDLEVKVTSDRPDPILPQRFADPGTMILSKKAYTTEDDRPVINAIGYGTGPFTWISASNTHAHLEANEDYWGEQPGIRSVYVTFSADPQELAEDIDSSRVDVAAGIPASSVPTVQEHAEVATISTPRTSLLYFNTAKGLFTRADVRSAAIDALDVDALVDEVYPSGTDTLDGTLFRTAERGDASVSPVELNTAPTGSIKNGPRHITMVTYTDIPELPQLAEAVAEQLRQAGFDVEITLDSYGNLENRILDGRFDLVLGSRNYMSGTADTLSYLASDVTCGKRYNIARYCNDSLDAEITSALSTSDATDREDEAVDIASEVLAAGAIVPIAVEHVYLGSRGVTGLVDDPFEVRLLTSDFRPDSAS
ncbi:Nickel-binding periplasmic protein precursor [Corynebacterium ciconiae DSM 44920]|uniref:ABC transporter substrate-binding protein n=1 Tax=Corynebacterium ciconiae TaxID=227319 RepID=UPI0003725FB6|nr:ABC transporter substrate-binding protein [Corynebacterium ciconiae]WKD61594.1 Nickel-binding periplasmic protein precursor [Corynebacterium ciconiae DSM 44920]